MGMSRPAGVVPAAAVSATLVLGGLSAVPPEPASQQAGRAAAVTVQIESIVLTAFDAAAAAPVADAATPTSVGVEPVSAAAATGSDDLLRTVLGVGIGLAVAPLWYIGFPVTVPLAIGLGVSAVYALNKIFIPGQSELTNVAIAAVGGSVLGAVGWVAGPLALGTIAANSLLPATTDPGPLADAAAAQAVRETAPEPTRALAQPATRNGRAAAVSATAISRVARAAAAQTSVASPSADDHAAAAEPESPSRKGSVKDRDVRHAPAPTAGAAGRR